MRYVYRQLNLTLFIPLCAFLGVSIFAHQVFSEIKSGLCERTPCYVESTEGSYVLIDVYEDRWFYEPQEEATPIHCLIFNSKNQYELNDCKNLKSVKEMTLDQSYHEHLEKSGAVVSHFPIHRETLVAESDGGHHKHEIMFGNFAWDLVIRKNGQDFSGDPEDVASYYIWDEPVFAPLSGQVVEVVRNIKDNPADPSMSYVFKEDEITPNYILIHIEGPYYFVIVHFKKDSIPEEIKEGVKIEAGQYLGRVGNSGVSYLPHLHITTYYKSKDLNRMMSVPTLLKTPDRVFQPKSMEVIDGRPKSKAL